MLIGMTTMTDGPSAAPADAPPPPPPVRTLRRSSTDRVGAGVAGGLGEYFGVDPVLFRVLFAVTSFFGGVGIIAYLLGWILIPEHGTEQAPLDRISAQMRRYKIPFWLVATVGSVLVWAIFFSWWAPGPAGGLVVAAIILAIVFSRRASRSTNASKASVTVTFTPPADGTDGPTARTAPMWTTTAPLTDEAPDPAHPSGSIAYPETRAWIAESRARRRRAAPVRWATLGALVLALAGIGIADSITGVMVPVYFWVLGGVVLAGLATGLILRRTPWVLTILLVPALIGALVFGTTKASLHDGSGRIFYTPTSADQLNANYRQAFGQLNLDLRALTTLDTPRTIDITLAGGQVQIKLPKSLKASVHANVRAGDVRVDQPADRSGDGPNDNGGFGLTHDVPAPAGASGAALTINVHLAAGDVNVEHS